MSIIKDKIKAVSDMCAQFSSFYVVDNPLFYAH